MSTKRRQNKQRTSNVVGTDRGSETETVVRRTDIAIVGGGLAGTTAAAMLGRAGYDAVLIDPHIVYPSGFRCEKLDRSQIHLLHKTGLADAVFRATTRIDGIWVARFGRLVDQKPNDQCGFLYETLVNTLRAEIPQSVEFIASKVTGISTSTNRQRITLSSGEEISARLVVMANGLNIGLRNTLDIEHEILSTRHSISIGFNLKPVGRSTFEFPALTYFPELTSDRMAYLTLFPIGLTMRANLFGYWDLNDPLLRRMRETPRETLFALMPGLRQLTGEIEITDGIKIRPVDLYVAKQHRQPGVVLVGDAFSTSCPAAGTGVNKVFTDVERLCNVHIPRWLASNGMGEEKIATFYDDAIKNECESFSLDKAFNLRSISMETGLSWQARRWVKFLYHLGLGVIRRVRIRPQVFTGSDRTAGRGMKGAMWH
jgi:2-polyprenyl-6-methoxyphenol hydroxylase-like FAD-dependent oxidoreductase